VQLIDWYTFNFGYVGSRTTGNGGGSYLITGPTWKGEKPQGIETVFPCETDFALAIFRTQLFNPADIDNVTGRLDAASSGGYGRHLCQEQLWKDWKRTDKLPDIDFTKELVVVSTTTGSRLRLALTLDDKGDLQVGGIATLDFRPGFRYVLTTVRNEGVKTVNAKGLPKE
jgi:hypothetical protein